MKIKFLLNSKSHTPRAPRGERGMIIFKLFTITYLAVSFFSVRPELIEGHKRNSFTVMIDPGDSSRTIDGIHERNITLTLALGLQNQLELLIPNANVVLTRTSNETIRPLANANFANRLNVDLFISLHCFAETQTRPKLALYTFAYGEQAPMQLSDLAFYTYDQAHLRAQRTTNQYAQLMEQGLAGYAKQFDFNGWYKIPFKPLIGIKAPAIGVEIGLKNKQGWQNFVEPLAEAVVKIMEVQA